MAGDDRILPECQAVSQKNGPFKESAFCVQEGAALKANQAFPHTKASVYYNMLLFQQDVTVDLS